MSRRTARKNAFFILYQSDVTGSSVEEIFRRWRSYRGELQSYAVEVARGVQERREELDGLLSEVSVGWPVRRMSAVDRTILRIGLYEMLNVEDVPPEVAVNEAVELARGFSGDEAPGFVGGVLRGAEGRVFGKVGHAPKD